ncbi:ribose transport system permease protein/rhamnose transport system permease protein [Arboricoccus pini]|uniref:Autoinducer 2 import system permease protein LsrC n=1 Tax=Arboricoccus pini TaxID=1963835 RepID=A0A212RGG8_9PROT|nr:ABC transporter permease [Arboricoccus pini]SNB71482.1 ribose transport system permease protein/rhamnose transport system permease protein [Arboricoccus pini]
MKLTSLPKARILVLFVLWLALLGLLAMFAPAFFQPAVLRSILQFSTVLALVSLGQALVVLGGGAGIDLAVGAMVSLVAILSMLAVRAGLPGFLLPPAAILLGGLLGLGNGLLVTRLGLLPLIATLGTLFLYGGLALALTGGGPVPGVPAWLFPFGRGTLGLVPWHFLAFVLPVFVLVALILSQTAWGRWVRAMGFRENAARLAGIPVSRVRLLLYVTSGLLAGMAALVTLAWFGSARPNIGQNLELESLAAVLVGGVSILGGAGGVFGVLAAVLFIVSLKTAMQFSNIATTWQVGAIGLLLILVLLIDRRTVRWNA